MWTKYISVDSNCAILEDSVLLPKLSYCFGDSIDIDIPAQVQLPQQIRLSSQLSTLAQYIYLIYSIIENKDEYKCKADSRFSSFPSKLCFSNDIYHYNQTCIQ